MRKEATKAGLTNNKGVRHAVAFKEDLYKTGRLKEVSMSLKSDGVVDSAKQAFYALRLWKHSKINPFELVVPQKPVNGIDGVRRLMNATWEKCVFHYLLTSSAAFISLRTPSIPFTGF